MLVCTCPEKSRENCLTKSLLASFPKAAVGTGHTQRDGGRCKSLSARSRGVTPTSFQRTERARGQKDLGPWSGASPKGQREPATRAARRGRRKEEKARKPALGKRGGGGAGGEGAAGDGAATRSPAQRRAGALSAPNAPSSRQGPPLGRSLFPPLPTRDLNDAARAARGHRLSPAAGCPRGARDRALRLPPVLGLRGLPIIVRHDLRPQGPALPQPVCLAHAATNAARQHRGR